MSIHSIMSSSNEEVENVGYVKWFNNKAGYGFLTVMSENRKDEDLFVHHTALETSDNQYKYLVQGEYVNFVFSKVTDNKNSDREWQATKVTGCCGGKLMCETRSEYKQSLAKKNKNTSGSDNSNTVKIEDN